MKIMSHLSHNIDKVYKSIILVLQMNQTLHLTFNSQINNIALWNKDWYWLISQLYIVLLKVLHTLAVLFYRL